MTASGRGPAASGSSPRSAAPRSTWKNSTPSLYIHLELDPPCRVRMLCKPADARAQVLAAVQSPRQRTVLPARHVAELATAPPYGDSERVVPVAGLAAQLERIADAQHVPERRRL